MNTTNPTATNDFQIRRAARIERLRAAADRKRNEAESTLKTARDRASIIPFGQPILVGHHSENRDRGYRAKIESGYRRGFEAMDAASALDAKASAAESNTAISSDDPDALEALRAKLAKLQSDHAQMIAINKLILKKNRAGLTALGLSEAQIVNLYTPDCFGSIGFASYKLTNSNGQMKQVKQRIASLEARSKMSLITVEINGVEIQADPIDNRVKMVFQGKPERVIIEDLKSNGFRWSPTAGAWQRNYNQWSFDLAKQIAGRVSQ